MKYNTLYGSILEAKDHASVCPVECDVLNSVAYSHSIGCELYIVSESSGKLFQSKMDPIVQIAPQDFGRLPWSIFHANFLKMNDLGNFISKIGLPVLKT